MKSYESYKDSGIEWIGEIPEHWKCVQLKLVAKIQNGSTPSTSNDDYWDGNINWVTTDDLGKLKGKSINFTKRLITKLGLESCGTKIAPIGAVIISTRAPIGHLGILNIEACTNQGCKTIISENLNTLFCYFYFIHSKSILESLGEGSTFKELPTSKLKSFLIPYPSLLEQIQIGKYLDKKTTQIDKLIADKQKLIELLNEERTAVINQAVTKGLNPDVLMKDSGIELLGDIPNSWQRFRIKNLVSTKVCDGPHETPNWLEDGIIFISAEAIKDSKIDFSVKRGYISKEQHLEYCKKSKVLNGDILFCKSGSTTGKSAIVDTETEFGIWSPLAIIRANRKYVNNNFLFQVIQSLFFKQQVEISWTFGTQPNIGMGALENLWIPLPSVDEQLEIISYLNEQNTFFEEMKIKIQQEIDLLKEYKTALISEVVTGRVDVRNEILN